MKKLFFVLFALLVLSGCRRENIIVETTASAMEPTVSVYSSLVGQVTDENGLRVQGAVVNLGVHQTYTNELGVFEFNDILISKDAAYVRVEKGGYFSGSRKFSTRVEETPYVKIELIAKEVLTIVQSEDGGVVNIESSKVTLPAGEYILNNGSKYSGEILVFGKYIDPTMPSTFNQMPGELTGIDLAGEEKVLASYGMINVKLTSLSGEVLSLPEGAEVKVEFKVPNSLLASAPGVMPLWRFDEVQGTWVEDGESVLEGDRLVTQVKHLSFWSCDVPYDMVTLTGYVVDYVGRLVKITDSSTGTGFYAVAGAGGFFSIKAPKDRILHTEIIGLCGGSLGVNLLEESFSTDTDSGMMEFSGPYKSISGVLDNCIEDVNSAGYVVVTGEDIDLIIPVNSDGSFYTELIECGSPIAVEIYGVDAGLGLYSSSLIADLNNLTNLYLLVCENYVQTGYDIFYEGQNWQSTNATDTSWVDFIIETSTGGGLDLSLSFEVVDPEVYDPLSGEVQCRASFVFGIDDDDVNYELDFESQGFRIAGICEKIMEQNGPFDVIIFHDVTQDIDVYDFSKYPDEATEVSFTIRI